MHSVGGSLGDDGGGLRAAAPSLEEVAKSHRGKICVFFGDKFPSIFFEESNKKWMTTTMTTEVHEAEAAAEPRAKRSAPREEEEEESIFLFDNKVIIKF